MSERERDRLKVLHEVEKGQLKQREAAAQLKMSERGFRKLLQRYRAKKDRAVVHGLRGRVSRRRLDGRTAARAVAAVKRDYADFGPTLAAEYLARERKIELSRETLRKLLISDGHWKPKKRQVKAVHVWRQRRSCRGELVQWDTSVHAWLEDRGPARMYLIALIDDATSRLFARFVVADSTEHHMRVLGDYLSGNGRPQAVYTDKASLFQPALAPGWKEEEPGPKTETQMGRALRELGIEWIAAHSPQAKGRVEGCFGTLQDRLVKGLRRARAASMEEANRYLEEKFLAEWNERFTVKAANGTDAHRPLGETLDLGSILSRMEMRQVTSDYTISWEGGRWQIPASAVRVGLRGAKVRVEARLDGTLRARIAGTAVELTRCGRKESTPVDCGVPVPRTSRRYIPPPGSSRWMKNFTVRMTDSLAAASAIPPGFSRPLGSLRRAESK